MTEALASKTCTPCRGGISPLTREQAELFHAQAPDWQLAEEAHRVERSFRFRNFREALTFVQEIGELAEAESHHPNISFGWGNATVSLQTKKIKGLHENDFIMVTKPGVNTFHQSAPNSVVRPSVAMPPQILHFPPVWKKQNTKRGLN